jgi:phosphoglycolate phosphatase-like HAD superfamily hydrolase
VRALAIDFDAVLGDTGPLWRAWIADASRRYRVELDETVDEAGLDEALGNWRVLLERFAEEHAPVYLRPDPDANAALRRLRARGTRLGAFTGAPAPLVNVAAAQLGIARGLDLVESGPGAYERLLASLDEATVVRTVDELVAASS